MTRLIHLAHAYELPLLQRLPRGGQPTEQSWTHPEAQFGRLEEEWAFLAERLADPLLGDMAPAKRN